jgi:hypothetical protein
MLAPMPVPVKNILSDIPKTGLFSVLVAGSRDFGVFDLLDVEGRHFNNNPRDGQDPLDLLNQFDVGIQFMPDRRRQPAFRFFPV